jgi:hypothetical protein
MGPGNSRMCTPQAIVLSANMSQVSQKHPVIVTQVLIANSHDEWGEIRQIDKEVCPGLWLQHPDEEFVCALTLLK